MATPNLKSRLLGTHLTLSPIGHIGPDRQVQFFKNLTGKYEVLLLSLGKVVLPGAASITKQWCPRENKLDWPIGSNPHFCKQEQLRG